MIETMNEVLDKVLADNLVETIANMNEEQRDKFVDTFVSKWPLLAGQISFNIESNLKDVEVIFFPDFNILHKELLKLILPSPINKIISFLV